MHKMQCGIEKIKDGANRSLLGRATQFISTGSHGGKLNAGFANLMIRDGQQVGASSFSHKPPVNSPTPEGLKDCTGWHGWRIRIKSLES